MRQLDHITQLSDRVMAERIVYCVCDKYNGDIKQSGLYRDIFINLHCLDFIQKVDIQANNIT